MIRSFLRKIFAYWCPYCPKRFITNDSFNRHWFICVGRQEADKAKQKYLESIAPVNRKQRRAMAKKAGQIKDWKELNED